MYWMLHRITVTMALLVSTTANAVHQTIPFKAPFSPQYSWVTLAVTLAILVVVTLVIAKKYKPNTVCISPCRLIEKKYLSNKTIVYILEYQQQRFLLADNQQSIALHPLESAIGISKKPLCKTNE